MAPWTEAELARIGDAEELNLSSERSDGSLRKPVTMWVVRVGDDLYVRAYKGTQGPWYRGTRDKFEGHIAAGGLDKDVTFFDLPAGADPDTNDKIDAVYKVKYKRYPGSLEPMLTEQAREATIRLLAR